MFRLNRHSRTLILLLIGVLLIRLSILWPGFIEQYYARGVYPYLGKALRLVTGWIPLSMGDVGYLFAILLIFKEIIHWFRWFMKKDKSRFLQDKLYVYLLFFLSLYLIFNVLWGLNYNRRSIRFQMDLPAYVANDTLLLELTMRLRDKANIYRAKATYDHTKDYAELAKKGYDVLAKTYPFVHPDPISLKPSLFGSIGNYMGYSGYFNPFTGEGQVNTTIPPYMLPFVTAHEMGHQLGYAKEHEASFVGHLAAVASDDPSMQYSSYLNMFLCAYGELKAADSTVAKKIWKGLAPEVLDDLKQYKAFLRRYETPIGEWVDQFYTQYLKFNEQPAGMRSYNLVTVWLMAWMRKHGDI